MSWASFRGCPVGGQDREAWRLPMAPVLLRANSSQVRGITPLLLAGTGKLLRASHFVVRPRRSTSSVSSLATRTCTRRPDMTEGLDKDVVVTRIDRLQTSDRVRSEAAALDEVPPPAGTNGVLVGRRRDASSRSSPRPGATGQPGSSEDGEGGGTRPEEVGRGSGQRALAREGPPRFTIVTLLPSSGVELVRRGLELAQRPRAMILGADGR